jgi:hypothetical protein
MNYHAMWLFQNNHIAIAILIVAFHRSHNDFCESLSGSPKKRICCVCRQMIILMTSLSAQHRSYMRLYTVARKTISTWKIFQRKVNTWKGFCLNLRIVFIAVHLVFESTIRPQISSHSRALRVLRKYLLLVQQSLPPCREGYVKGNARNMNTKGYVVVPTSPTLEFCSKSHE